MRMDVGTWLAMPIAGMVQTTLAEVNGRLSASGLSISREDARMLVAGRAEALAAAERVEFGPPAIVEIAEAVAGSPCLLQSNVAETLAGLQDAFYAIRDELAADVPDAEIAEALRGCLDEWGDVATVASMPAEEVMAFSVEHARAVERTANGEYRIVDDDGREYAFGPDGWDYDEHADGWDGEGWADDWAD